MSDSDIFGISVDPFQYTETVDGRFGQFQSSTGRVHYLLTSAKLGAAGSSSAASLTEHLRPVREVLPVGRMNFNQLLQRDIDDHRVATQMIPYLFQNPLGNTPSFFPPILAVILPVTRTVHSGFFPSASDVPAVINDGGSWLREDFGQYFRVDRLLADHGEEHFSRYARLSWHRRNASLVVLDGQHRAMALLAIHRTINDLWATDTQADLYRHFYEEPVRRLIASAGVPSELEVPIALCWFPDVRGSTTDPVAVARRLFVDVNQSARPPSEARLILLSDENLIHIFVRSTLNELRGDSEDEPTGYDLPLYAIDYDNPETQTRTARWTVVTTVGMLNGILDRVIHGPPRIIENLAVGYGRGRGRDAPREARFREQLAVIDWPIEVIEGERMFRRSSVSATHFPEGRRAQLEAEFQQGWGTSLLRLLSRVVPYSAHMSALRELRSGWGPAGTEVERLAKEALFEGVGMYWVLRDSHEYYTTRFASRNVPESAQELVAAWGLLQEKQREFSRLRLEALGLASTAAQVDAMDRVFDVYRTAACQLGLLLTVATLADRLGLKGADIPRVADEVITGVNAYFNMGSEGSCGPRWMVMSPRADEPVNRISDMNTPRGVEFRYFWLEVLAAGLRQTDGGGLLSDLSIDELAAEARAGYLKYRTSERARDLRRLDAHLTNEDSEIRAREEVRVELRGGLEAWFELTSAQFSAWWSAMSERADVEVDDEEAEDGGG